MAEIIKHDKDVYYSQLETVTGAAAEWTPPQKTALAARMLDLDGQGISVAGQISMRLDDGSFWTQTFGLGFDEAKASNQLRISPNLEVLEGKGRPNPANRFHSYTYAKRPDVRAIVHTHAPYTMALSMIGAPLIPSTMETVAIWNDIAHLETWPGVPVGDSEGEIISTAIGDKRTILLAHHGLLTVGKSMEEATALAIIVELAAKLQLLAMPAGKIRPLPQREAEEAYEFASKPSYYERRYNLFARRVLAMDSSVLD